MASLATAPVFKLSLRIYLIDDDNPIVTNYELDIANINSCWDVRTAPDIDRLLDAIISDLPNLSAWITPVNHEHQRFTTLEVCCLYVEHVDKLALTNCHRDTADGLLRA